MADTAHLWRRASMVLGVLVLSVSAMSARCLYREHLERIAITQERLDQAREDLRETAERLGRTEEEIRRLIENLESRYYVPEPEDEEDEEDHEASG